MILPSIILPFIFLFGMGLCLFEDGRIIGGRMMKSIPNIPASFLEAKRKAGILLAGI